MMQGLQLQSLFYFDLVLYTFRSPLYFNYWIMIFHKMVLVTKGITCTNLSFFQILNWILFLVLLTN